MNANVRIRFLSAVAIACLAPSLAWANDSVMGGAGADLVPMKTADVSMVSEDIELTYRDGNFLVDARYQFQNQTDSALALQFGFPEYRCEETEVDCVSPQSFKFENMQTEVRGESVLHHKGKVAKRHAWAPRLGNVWLFDVRFAPHETVRVRHTYQVPTTQVVDGSQHTTYVTRTGALWAGPIGHALFRVRLPVNAIELYSPKIIPRTGTSSVTVEGRKLAEVRFEARDWMPTSDLSFGFRTRINPWEFDESEYDVAPKGPAQSGLPESERCESFLLLWQLGQEALLPEPGPDLEQRIKTALSRGKNSRRICKNTVFAVHGRRFNDERLNRYFYGPKGFVVGQWPYGPLQPNPNFDPSLLGKDEWKTIELIDRLPIGAGDLATDEVLPTAARAGASHAKPIAQEVSKPSATAESSTSAPRPAPASHQTLNHGCGCNLQAHVPTDTRGSTWLVLLALLPLRKCRKTYKA